MSVFFLNIRMVRYDVCLRPCLTESVKRNALFCVSLHHISDAKLGIYFKMCKKNHFFFRFYALFHDFSIYLHRKVAIKSINMNHLVIMAGGIGSRFWPMSTPECPKQFLDIMGSGRTMIQQTFERFSGLVDIGHVWVVTSKNFKDLVSEQLHGINPQHILLEPCMRNTAPCVAYVSWKIQAEDPDANIFVAASDHLVTNETEFNNFVATQNYG